LNGCCLPGSQIETTQLGFGGAYLTGGWEARGNRRLVDIAFEVGIRHFDVAPVYGIGTAEDVLGDALKGRRERVTIASKVGIARPCLTAKVQAIRFLAQPLRKLAPSLTHKGFSHVTNKPTRRGQFSCAFVEASLTETLRRLKTDYLDILHLHEVALEDISDKLLTFLDVRRRQGMFRCLGVASAPERMAPIAASEVADAFDVLQYSWCVLDGGTFSWCPEKFHITHRAIMNAYAPLQQRFAAEPALRARLSEATAMDIARPGELARVLLGAALAHNRSGITLFASRRADRIVSGVRALQAPGYIEAGAKLALALAGAP